MRGAFMEKGGSVTVNVAVKTRQKEVGTVQLSGQSQWDWKRLKNKNL
ncbi:hypothetical protein TorRG33x02_076440 [Trema orientale]|uniref:Uncharacterized protein n=1 Tax=Trema orientale TaxID=63057 RepID=A0A2P5FFV4_TREOI|nr:hypothetical protein TorRG33x02_076440 [Trema orientale]